LFSYLVALHSPQDRLQNGDCCDGGLAPRKKGVAADFRNMKKNIVPMRRSVVE
jgi:hypothetical protein